jgi:SLOG cluster3 family
MKPGEIIFLSGSVPYRAGWTEDAKPQEIEEAIVSIARAVFARQGRLLFGGHPSVSPLIAAVAGEYFPADPSRRIRPVVTFQSELFRRRLPDETWELHRMGWSAIEWSPEVLKSQHGEADRELSLRLMREWMLLAPGTPPEILMRNELTPPAAMIAVGGMEGVRDEAAMFLRHRAAWGFPRLPVYVIVSGGGAAARLAEGPELRPQRLWPEGQPIDGSDLATLMTARQERQIIPLEQTWRAHMHVRLPSETEFEPYAAMAQWLMDEL